MKHHPPQHNIAIYCTDMRQSIAECVGSIQAFVGEGDGGHYRKLYVGQTTQVRHQDQVGGCCEMLTQEL